MTTPPLTFQQALALAVQHHQAGRLPQAEQLYRQVLALQPNQPDALHLLGVLATQVGQLDAAIDLLRQSLAQNPRFAETHNDLGNALMGKGQLDAALDAYRQAVALKPAFDRAHNNLGVALKATGQIDAALAAFRRAIALNPAYAQAHSNLGNALLWAGDTDAAVAAFRQAIALAPADADVHANLAGALKDMGQLDESLAAFRHAAALAPANAALASKLLYTLHFHAASTAATLADEHRRWNQRFAQPLRPFIAPHTNDRSPDRRLRIGYVSPDFRAHPIGRFLLPLLAHHDQSQVELFAYSDVSTPDSLTAELRTHFDHWRPLVGLADAQAVDLIRADAIDILVDLSMHMAGNRLLLFARKPAPIQLTYLAYCSTTGLDAIDYRFSDPHLDPPGVDESLYAEKTLRLPDTYWCYQPPTAPPDVAPPPALAAGHVTFGSLNNFCKVTPPTLAAWTTLLQTIPNAHLLLHAPPGSHRQRLLDQLARAGIDPARIRFAGFLPTADYFALYHAIDIALDTFPCTGGTTTCDALFMGVPTVTLAGNEHQSPITRGSASILFSLDLPDLIAHTAEQYVQIAASLARDLPRLADLRATLRQRMERSLLMDAPRFARAVEAAYRRMWRNWCAGADRGPRHS